MSRTERRLPPAARPRRRLPPGAVHGAVSGALFGTLLCGLGLLGPARPAQAGAASGGAALRHQISVAGAGAGLHEQLELSATPGRDNELRFGVACRTEPAGGTCPSGSVVLRFPARPTQVIRRAWDPQGIDCEQAPYYVRCPIPPIRDGFSKWMKALMYVDPGEYADNAGTIEGLDGVAMPRHGFVVRMLGEGSLSIHTPFDITVRSDTRVTRTRVSFHNVGPSVNRNVRYRIGPFPDYLEPYVVLDETRCTVQTDWEGKMVNCHPPDLFPAVSQAVTMFLVAKAAKLPPLPVRTYLKIEGFSDLERRRDHAEVDVVEAEPAQGP